MPDLHPRPPAPRHGDLGYASLWVPDVGRAAAFFAAVLGWRYGPASGPDGRQVQGQSLHHGLWGGVEPPTLFCCYAADDLEAALARVAGAGGDAGTARLEPFGRTAGCTDDQGVRFALYQPPEGVGAGPPAPANGTRAGDLAYVTIEVVDGARARAFYGEVLGWRFLPGTAPDGWQVDGVAPMTGLSGGHERATTVPMYRVDDVRAAVDAVRAAGGTTTDPERQPYGVTASCTDDQGTRFFLGQLPE